MTLTGRYMQEYDIYIPVEENNGPKALAKAPSDLNTPITVPFWSLPPYNDVIVVRHGTTVAEAKIQQ